MIANNETHTSPRQRIAILAVAVFMLISTCALYVGIVLSAGKTNNPGAEISAESKLSPEEQKKFDELYTDYMKQREAQSKELSDKYFGEFVGYKSRVKSFNKADVNSQEGVIYEDLKIGDGAEVTGEDFVDYSAYYIGWIADEGGKIFDSSFNDAKEPTALIAPLAGTPGLIDGWKQGIKGMKIGGVRELTIPSAMAYKEQEMETIPANSPLKFVIMLIPKVTKVEPSEELMNLYNKMSGIEG